MTTFYGLLQLPTVMGDKQMHDPEHLQSMQDETVGFMVNFRI